MRFNKTRIRAIWPLLAIWALIAPAPAEAQRLGLWPSDAGTSLPIKRYDVQVTINHPVVETVVTQEFENSSRFDLETTFYYPVPAGATVAGMALWVKGERREARMLERQKAREIYNGIVAKKRDPALLERIDGNTFKIRIFPVLARSRTRVELRFVQPVSGGIQGKYHVTLRKPPGATIHVLRLGVSLRAPIDLGRIEMAGYPESFTSSGEQMVMVRPASVRSFKRDITLTYDANDGRRGPAAALLDHGGERLVVAHVPPGQRQTSARKVVLLVDSSRSMSPHLSLAHRLVEHYLDSMADGDQAAVVPFQLLPADRIRLASLNSHTRASLTRKVEDLKGEGGTAFVPAFKAAMEAGADHIICITDGGTRYHQAELEALLRILVDRPGVTVSVITPEKANNADATRDLVKGTGGVHQPLTSESSPVTVAKSLAAVPRRISVKLAQEVGEVHLISRDAGGTLLALRLPAGAAKPMLRLSHEQERTVQLDLGSAPSGVKGAGVLFASAAIQDLMRRIKVVGEEPKLREAVVKLSQEHKVLSEYTALLATETDAQYDNPTSGRKWQRQTTGFEDDLPSNSSSYSSTPEPHEYLLMGLGLLALMVARKRGWIGESA